MTERRWRLRDATMREHQALDMAVGAFGDRESYAAYTLCNFRFRAAIEPATPAPEGGWQPRRLLPALRQDLTDLGITPPDVDIAPAAQGSALLGRLYVLEGAALGGQILAGRAAALGLSRTFGARHLAGDATNWAAFLHHLDHAPGYDENAAAEGARAAFDMASRAFAKDIA